MVNVTKSYIEDNSTPVTESGCWIWDGYCNPDGYGQRKINGATLRMHRASYALYTGEIPDGMCVCHSCDTPQCCNPAHLFIGTHSDNMKDMWNKGRHVKPKGGFPRKLTEEQVLEIRDTDWDISQKAIGKLYGVTDCTIGLILRRINWKHI